jgi:transposase-like protein
MARPLKDDGNKRNSVIQVRFTAAEKSRLVRTADERGFTVSDFIRVHSLNAAPLHRKASGQRADLIKALAELGKVGSNVNQVAKALNTLMKNEKAERVPNELVHNALYRVSTLTNHLIKLLADGN